MNYQASQRKCLCIQYPRVVTSSLIFSASFLVILSPTAVIQESLPTKLPYTAHSTLCSTAAHQYVYNLLHLSYADRPKKEALNKPKGLQKLRGRAERANCHNRSVRRHTQRDKRKLKGKRSPHMHRPM